MINTAKLFIKNFTRKFVWVRIGDVRGKMQETRDKRQETRDKRQETGDRNQESGYWTDQCRIDMFM